MAGYTSQLVLHLHQESQKRVPQEESSNQTTKPYLQVVYSITHALPGKVGFCVPRISEDPEYVHRLWTLLHSERLVINQQISSMAGSIVITYKTGVMSDAEMRSQLVSLIQSASTTQPKTVSATAKPVSSSSTPQLISCSVTPSKEDSTSEVEEGKVEEGVSLDFQSVGVRICYDDESLKTGELHNSELLGAKVSRRCGLEGINKIPTQHNKLNHAADVQQASPGKRKQRAKQPAKLVYSIAHAIPGRVRFRVPRIAKDPKYVQRLKALLKADPAVTSERVNSAAASIVITYKSGGYQNAQKPSATAFEKVLSHLSSLIKFAASETVPTI